jgi:hypothetical protein
MYVNLPRGGPPKHSSHLTRAIPWSASAASHNLTKKIGLSKSHHGQSYMYEPCRTFLPAFLMADFPYMAISCLGITLWLWLRHRHGRHAHTSRSTGLAPRHRMRMRMRCPWDFPGLVNTSRTSLVRNNERYLAFPLAVTGAFSEGTRS